MRFVRSFDTVLIQSRYIIFALADFLVDAGLLLHCDFPSGDVSASGLIAPLHHLK
jgi:hypothetical protein